MRKMFMTMGLMLLAACSPAPSPELTPEERLVSETFTMLSTATAYDEICNASIHLNERNENLYGNMRALGAEMFKTIRNNRPEKSRADIENQIRYQGQYAVARAREVMDNKGCEAPESRKFEQALKVFTQTPPAKVIGALNEQMLKEGITRAPQPPAK